MTSSALLEMAITTATREASLLSKTAPQLQNQLRQMQEVQEQSSLLLQQQRKFTEHFKELEKSRQVLHKEREELQQQREDLARQHCSWMFHDEPQWSSPHSTCNPQSGEAPSQPVQPLIERLFHPKPLAAWLSERGHPSGYLLS